VGALVQVLSAGQLINVVNNLVSRSPARLLPGRLLPGRCIVVGIIEHDLGAFYNLELHKFHIQFPIYSFYFFFMFVHFDLSLHIMFFTVVPNRAGIPVCARFERYGLWSWFWRGLDEVGALVQVLSAGQLINIVNNLVSRCPARLWGGRLLPGRWLVVVIIEHDLGAF